MGDDHIWKGARPNRCSDRPDALEDDVMAPARTLLHLLETPPFPSLSSRPLPQYGRLQRYCQGKNESVLDHCAADAILQRTGMKMTEYNPQMSAWHGTSER